jgi:hypothetical protein
MLTHPNSLYHSNLKRGYIVNFFDGDICLAQQSAICPPVIEGPRQQLPLYFA